MHPLLLCEASRARFNEVHSMLLTSGDPLFFNEISRRKNNAADFDRVERQIHRSPLRLKGYFFAESVENEPTKIKILTDVQAPTAGW